MDVSSRALYTFQQLFPTEQILELCPSTIQQRGYADYAVVREAVHRGVVPSTRRKMHSHWGVWTTFCGSLGIPPALEGIRDPVPLLQLFAHRIRTGEYALKGDRIRKRSVEQYLRSVGQAFSCVGAPDIRFGDDGKLDFRLSRQLRSYMKEDPPPTRVKPLPIPILMHCYMSLRHGTEKEQLIADLIFMAFYYLLRPGESCAGGTDAPTTYFRYKDATLYQDQRRVKVTSPRWNKVNFSQLFLSIQKNLVWGESIGHGLSGHPFACPTKSIKRIVERLHHWKASDDTPLCAYKEAGAWKLIKSTDITKALRTAVKDIGHRYGLCPQDISARSLRASGAMALLLGGVDANTIKLLGRWRSDEMMRYLHVSAQQLVHKYATADYLLLAPTT